MAAAAADKARFFLEQSVPELQEYKEKGIFSASEITSISSKRSSFEHRINMAGASSPTDFAQYASYEMNLDLLRKKRCQRMGIKGTGFAGQKRVFGVLERGTRKFPGDIPLWMQYLGFCQKERANAKLAKGLTKVLRLHPTKWELWVFAARYYFETQGDITASRSYMQRGLRFCETQRDMWLQYLRLEMIYLSKLAARRKILRLDQDPEREQFDGDMDRDEVALPVITEDDLGTRPKDRLLALDDETIKRLAKSPALSGAIPTAIAEAAIKTFRYDARIFEECLDCLLAFGDVQAVADIIGHVGSKAEHCPNEHLREPLQAVFTAATILLPARLTSTNVPGALASALQTLKKTPQSSVEAKVLVQRRLALLALTTLSMSQDMDDGVVKVLRETARQSTNKLKAITDDHPRLRPAPLQSLKDSIAGYPKIDKSLAIGIGEKD